MPYTPDEVTALFAQIDATLARERARAWQACLAPVADAVNAVPKIFHDAGGPMALGTAVYLYLADLVAPASRRLRHCPDAYHHERACQVARAFDVCTFPWEMLQVEGAARLALERLGYARPRHTLNGGLTR